MRKQQKAQIETFLNLLTRAHEEIKKSISSGKPDIALDLLAQCQDSALQIGETIEHFEGNNSVTIPLLESYCEVVYQVYETLTHHHPLNPSKTYKTLQKSLTPIKTSVKTGIPVRTEAVFLPYKASMWDSLESVWKAADEDPSCDAYVIPIPYFDKNPDGSFKEEHYEGDLYPDYVPITRYEDYDFAERQPDLIFIHNPYDECNYVTSVHPFFYSKNLKQFTEKLVYIPYFILGEPDPEDEHAIEGIKHFCTVPGVIYADKVIVQSEAMRKVYVKVLTDYSKGSKADRKYWEEKILGLGSPKVDKVLSTKKEEIEIPNEWKKVIEKEDRSWKKIIFYNTSVTTLLEHEEKYLEKMRDVFRVFKENVDEVALLWRPHPLMQATIESMRPELWGEYERLVEEYIEEGWGIYDDTAELDRAIAVCDGYYGDASSVVRLCQEKGKMVLIQNIEIIFPVSFPVPFDYAYQEDSDIWLIGNKDNSLWNLDLEKKQLRYITWIPTNIRDTFRINTRCIKYKNDVFCLPDRGDKIAIYNLCTKDFRYCEIETFGEERIGIYNSWKYEDAIWCLSYYMQKVIKINLNCISIEEMHQIFEIPNQLMGYEAVMHKENIYCVSRNTTIIGKFNIFTKKIQYYKLSIVEKGFNTITTDGNDFYITGYRKAVYIWNEDTNQVKILEDFPEEYKIYNEDQEIKERYCDIPVFFRSISTQTYIAFIPWNLPEARSNGILIYDKLNKKLISVNLEKKLDINKIFYSICYQKPNGILGIFCRGKNTVLEINKEYQIMHENNFIICGQDNFVSTVEQNIKEMIEYETINLRKCIELVRYRNDEEDNIILMNFGSLVWNEICNI